MRKTLFITMLSLFALWGRAQEKVMNVVKTDNTRTQTRLADLKGISFLAVDAGRQGLIVKSVGGETTEVLFETNPVVTAANGKLTIKPGTDDGMEFEINDIAEIVFGEVTTGISLTPDPSPKGEGSKYVFVLQDRGATLRNISEGVKPRVYAVDGRSLPTPPVVNGELLLNRATLGSGVFIVKVGAFSTKIKL